MNNPVVSINNNSFRIRSSNDGWIAKTRAVFLICYRIDFIAASIYCEFKWMFRNMQEAISG